MEELVTVLSVKKYSFVNAEGQKLEGCTVHYFPSPTFDPVSDEPSGLLGMQPLKATMGIEFFEVAKNAGIPCHAKVRYVMRSQGGNMIMKPAEIEFYK